MESRIDVAVLEDKLSRVEGARSWRPRVVSKLESLLRTGRDEALFRVDPLAFAREQGLGEQEAVDLFLHAAHVGLFELRWHLLCAFCGHVVESLAELGKLHAHYRCSFCSAMNEAALDDYIQVSFTVSPHVREISYHRPERLEIRDYYLRYHFARGVTFASGATLEQVGEAITRFMGWVEPGERVAFDTEIAPGRLVVKDLWHRASIACFLTEPRRDRDELQIRLQDGVLGMPHRGLTPRRLAQTKASFEYDATLDLESGVVRLEFTNASAERCPLWVIHLPAAFESAPVGIAPFLTGKHLLTVQTFKELFRAETFSAHEGIAVRDMAFLFTDLKSSTELYEAVGDLNAFFLVRQHFDALTQAIASHGGAMVKTIGDAVMATFPTPAQAVRGALAMLAAMRRFNEGVSTPLHLKVGVHRGPAIAVTLNDRVDYFGQTVNTAARIQGAAAADEICLGESTCADPDVQVLLAGVDVRREGLSLKGVSGKVDVGRFRA